MVGCCCFESNFLHSQGDLDDLTCAQAISGLVSCT
jgi:hypothetical protein